MNAVVRLYNPNGPDKVAVLSIQAASGPAGGYNLQLARGPRRTKLTRGNVYGPFPREELFSRLTEVIDALKAEGFLRAGLRAQISQLASKQPKARARAALRLGWM